MSAIKEVAFDIDDTLYDLAEPFRKACGDYPGVRDLPLDELFLDFRRRSDEVFLASENGEISMDDMYAYRIQKALEDYGISFDREQALRFQHAYNENQKNIGLTDTMRHLLDELAACGVRIAIVSNGPSEHQREKIDALGLGHWFQDPYILISGDVGVAKPDPEIFRIAEQRMGFSGESAWYVGDTFKNDIVGASKAGWHTIWFNRRKKTRPADGPVPDRTVKTEEELARVLLSYVKAD